MRPEKWWLGLTLAAAALGSALAAELPIILVKQDSRPLSLAASGDEPFVELTKHGVWCSDGACWAVDSEGMTLVSGAGSVYESIGLEDGDVLLRVDSRRLNRSLSALTVPGDRLRRYGSVCLQLERDGESIEMGIVMPEATDRGGACEEPISATPCADLRAEKETRSRRGCTG